MSNQTYKSTGGQQRGNAHVSSLRAHFEPMDSLSHREPVFTGEHRTPLRERLNSLRGRVMGSSNMSLESLVSSSSSSSTSSGPRTPERRDSRNAELQCPGAPRAPRRPRDRRIIGGSPSADHLRARYCDDEDIMLDRRANVCSQKLNTGKELPVLPLDHHRGRVQYRSNVVEYNKDLPELPRPMARARSPLSHSVVYKNRELSPVFPLRGGDSSSSSHARTSGVREKTSELLMQTQEPGKEMQRLLKTCSSHDRKEEAKSGLTPKLEKAYLDGGIHGAVADCCPGLLPPVDLEIGNRSDSDSSENSAEMVAFLFGAIDQEIRTWDPDSTARSSYR